MKYGELIIEKREYNFIKQLISLARYYKDSTYKLSLEKLNKELEHARIVPNKLMPKDIIRLNSIVTIETLFNDTRTYQVVTPEKSNIKENRISILAPMGLALFGYAESDKILWQFPMGESPITIKKVEQPEKKVFKKRENGVSRTSQ